MGHPPRAWAGLPRAVPEAHCPASPESLLAAFGSAPRGTNRSRPRASGHPRGPPHTAHLGCWEPTTAERSASGGTSGRRAITRPAEAPRSRRGVPSAPQRRWAERHPGPEAWGERGPPPGGQARAAAWSAPLGPRKSGAHRGGAVSPRARRSVNRRPLGEPARCVWALPTRPPPEARLAAWARWAAALEASLMEHRWCRPGLACDTIGAPTGGWSSRACAAVFATPLRPPAPDPPAPRSSRRPPLSERTPAVALLRHAGNGAPTGTTVLPDCRTRGGFRCA
jgi:hypothetical protein